jgi:hypothetical protein
LSPLVIVLLVLGGVLVLGGGACVVLSGLVLIGASADPDPSTASPSGTAATPAVTATATSTATPPPAPSEEGDGLGAGADEDGDKGKKAAPSTGTGTWWCTASGSARVCGFAGACNYQMVFGNGTGKDRFMANTQAKNACEAMARAKGSSAVCVVQCSLR